MGGQGAVFAGAPSPADTAPRAEIASVHFVSSADAVTPEAGSRALAALYGASAVVVAHDLGHALPTAAPHVEAKE